MPSDWVEVLLAAGCDIQLTISAAAQTVIKQELGLAVDLDKFDARMLWMDPAPTAGDERLQRMRALAGISSESSNVPLRADG